MSPPHRPRSGENHLAKQSLNVICWGDLRTNLTPSTRPRRGWFSAPLKTSIPRSACCHLTPGYGPLISIGNGAKTNHGTSENQHLFGIGPKVDHRSEIANNILLTDPVRQDHGSTAGSEVEPQALVFAAGDQPLIGRKIPGRAKTPSLIHMDCAIAATARSLINPNLST